LENNRLLKDNVLANAAPIPPKRPRRFIWFPLSFGTVQYVDKYV
jgi:hypothetical protein